MPGKTLCAAGTIDDCAALIDRTTMNYKFCDTATTLHSYAKEYWTTEGLNNTCWISLREPDSVPVLSFDTKKELACLPVGDPPAADPGRLPGRARARVGACLKSLGGWGARATVRWLMSGAPSVVQERALWVVEERAAASGRSHSP